MQDRVEQDAIELLNNLSGTDGRGTMFKQHTAAGKLNYVDILAAADLLNEEEQNEKHYIIVGRKGALQIRTDERFIDKISFKQPVIATGVVGSIGGCEVVISNRIDELDANKAYIIQPEPFTAVMKRDVLVETERITRRLATLIVASQHYIVGIPDYRKIVVLNFSN